MNRIKHFIIILVLVSAPITLVGQGNICDCCSYASLQYQQDYDEVFDPLLIKSEGIKEVMVYTKPKSADSTALTKYREIKFKFDDNGLVFSKVHYNRKGKPHSIYDLKRNKAGKIYQQIFNYVDSLEQKDTFFGQEIIDFKYDKNNRLIKIKERDYKGNVLPDNKAKYTQFDYDNKDRITRVRSHRNYDNEESLSITSYRYLNHSYSATYKSISNGELNTSGEKKYNNNWKEIYDKTYNEALKSLAFEEYFEYDSEDRLTKYKITSGPGSFDECPENSTYVDTYTYNDSGFILRINHTYLENTCEMTFEYRK
jgi:hypothetical protein